MIVPVTVTDVPTKDPSPRMMSDVPSNDSILEFAESDSLMTSTPMVPAVILVADSVVI